MNAVYVPTIPLALHYMRNYQGPPWYGCRGKTLLAMLGKCSEDYRCEACRFADECKAKYYEIIDQDIVKNWKETARHVTKYFK